MNDNKIVKIAKVLYKLLSVAQVGALLAGILVVSMGVGAIIKKGKNFIDLKVVTFGSLSVTFFNTTNGGSGNESMIIILMIVSVVLICVMSLLFLSTLCRILEPMKEGTPFEAGVSKMIRKLGILVLIYGVLSQALQYLVTYLPFNTYDMASLFNFENVIKYEYRFRPDTSFLIVALVIFLLSYVFKYGEQLQRESDETL